MAKHGESYVLVSAKFIARTMDAVYVETNSERHWIPRTVLAWECDNEVEELKKNQEFELKLAEWKANQLGLEY